jgi:endonuclease YncB( thermonuclease family)
LTRRKQNRGLLKSLYLPLIVALLLGGPFSACSVQKHAPALSAVQSSTQEFIGRVTAVTDGDTIEVLRDGAPTKIRLNGIDAPERKQLYGSEATQFTSELVFNKSVIVRVQDVDRYQRLVADVILEDGRSLNQELVKAGWAWWYEKYAPKAEILRTLQHEAQVLKKGLWQQENPTPPWEFRKKVVQ